MNGCPCPFQYPVASSTARHTPPQVAPPPPFSSTAGLASRAGRRARAGSAPGSALTTRWPGKVLGTVGPISSRQRTTDPSGGRCRAARSPPFCGEVGVHRLAEPALLLPPPQALG